MQDVLTTIVNYIQGHWPTILSLIGGAGGVSLVLETFLNKLHINSKKLAYTLLHIVSVITTVVTFLLANLPAFDALPMYASIVIFAQTWHRFVISPAYNKFIVPYLQYLETNKPLPKSVPDTTPATELPEPENEFTT